MEKAYENLAGGQSDSPDRLASACGRQRNWCELSLEEKIERLRDVLRATTNKADYASRTIGEVKTLVEVHQHAPITGQVLRPAMDFVNFASDKPLGYRGHDQLA